MTQQAGISRKYILSAFTLLLLCTLLVAAVFLMFSLAKYNERVLSVGAETFATVTETTAQRLRNQMSHQWTVLDSFSAFLSHDEEVSESEILYYMGTNRRLWRLKELAFRTETGRHFNSFGNEFFLDEERSRQNPPVKNMWLVENDLMYLIHPINTKTTFRNEEIQVISASETISSLLLEIAPIEFRGQMQTYFMTKDGTRMNEDHHLNSFSDTNLLRFAESYNARSSMGHKTSVTTAVTANQVWIGTVRTDSNEFYLGFFPIEEADTVYYLVTAIETSWVNTNNVKFGEHVLLLSFILISLSVSLVCISFMAFNHKNREYVQDLLISNKRDSDTQLEAALELAQQSNAAKTAFLSNMSHDIRTPMNAIINMTDFALKELDDRAKLEEYLGVIHTSSSHLLHLINDVLDMTHIESGKMILKHEPFTLSKLQDDVSKIIGAAASKKRITFKTRVISLTKDKLRGDELRLQQVLINLLNNAIKFTPEGGTVVLTVEEIPSVKYNYQGFRFIITDTGCGISADTLDTIFEPFSRIEKKGQRIEGSGLGLAITKSIVDAMEGEITVQSTPDVGSIFTVRMFFEIDDENIKPLTVNDLLPEEVRSGAIPVEEALLPTDFKGIRVLIAEDILINQQILSHILQNINIICDFASNGQEAVDLFLKSDPFWYSLILMDIQMPVMDGYEATRTIRLSNHPQANIIPIIAMTANVFDEDVDRCSAAGMNAHLGKPIDPEMLIKTIAAQI